MIARRGLLKVLGGLIAAPAIVKVADLMPVKPSLTVPTGHGLRIGDTLRIRLPNDFVVRGAGTVDVLFGSTQVRPEWATLTEVNHHPQVPYEPLRVPELELDELSERVIRPSVERLEHNVLLSINEITCEAVKIFSQENLFLKYIEDAPVLDPILDQPVTPLQAAALGAAAVLGRNPVVSRRFFGGVREEGSVASPGSSSSDPSRRNTNQETVA